MSQTTDTNYCKSQTVLDLFSDIVVPKCWLSVQIKPMLAMLRSKTRSGFGVVNKIKQK